jgi:hypothetical protein
VRIHLRGSDHNFIGYGRMSLEIGKALKRQGVELTDEAGTVLGCQLPMHMDSKFAGQSVNVFTMFETDHLPEEFTENLGNFDTLFVPCEENRRSYSEYHDDVRIVPLGVDPEVWKPTERRAVTYDRPFTFLTGGSGGHRKGFDLSIRAFLRVKSRAEKAGLPTPRLKIKCGPTEPNRALKDKYNDPDIIWTEEWVPAAAEVAMYDEAHCYVSASRGEGWGLWPNQAIANGLPTLLAPAAGQLAFAPYAVGLLGFEVVPAQYGVWGPVGNWWEPTEQSVTDQMWHVLTHYEEAKEMAWKYANDIPYTWDNTATELLKHLPDLPDHGTEVVRFNKRLYRIRTNKDITCDIADVKKGFRAGVDYWDSADVKRVLWNNGSLTEECVAEGTGLLPEQIEGYAGAMDLCPACGRTLDPVGENT